MGEGSTDERIRDQFILVCVNDKIREDLWLKGDPKLSEVVLVAKQIEHSQACVVELLLIPNQLWYPNIDICKKHKGDVLNVGHWANSKNCPVLKCECSICGGKKHIMLSVARVDRALKLQIRIKEKPMK